MHNQIATQYAPGDDLPCADSSLLTPLKKSSEYRVIRSRAASPKAVDSWQDQGYHFFVFQLRPRDDEPEVPNDPPVVVFTMHTEQAEPVSVVVVTPQPGGAEARIEDLRSPNGGYSARLAS
jgi:hypothetical protein